MKHLPEELTEKTKKVWALPLKNTGRIECRINANGFHFYVLYRDYQSLEDLQIEILVPMEKLTPNITKHILSYA